MARQRKFLATPLSPMLPYRVLPYDVRLWLCEYLIETVLLNSYERMRDNMHVPFDQELQQLSPPTIRCLTGDFHRCVPLWARNASPLVPEQSRMATGNSAPLLTTSP